MSINRKFENVYDGVINKTPLQKMREAQEARKKVLAGTKKKEGASDGTDTKSSNRSTKSGN